MCCFAPYGFDMSNFEIKVSEHLSQNQIHIKEMEECVYVIGLVWIGVLANFSIALYFPKARDLFGVLLQLLFIVLAREIVTMMY